MSLRTHIPHIWGALVMFLTCWIGAIPCANGHLLIGRRPLDYFVGRADSLVVARITTATRKHELTFGSVSVTEFAIESCVSGVCPRGQVRAAGMDEHAAELEAGRRVLLALKADTVKLDASETVAWRIMQNEWELRTFGRPYVDESVSWAKRYASILQGDSDERESKYLAALIGQIGAQAISLQEDALQSLLRFPTNKVSPAVLQALLMHLSTETAPATRIGLMAVANGWDAEALRQRLAALDISRFDDESLTRALLMLGAGTREQMSLPCAFGKHVSPTVRGAAISACAPLGGAWLSLALEALQDPAPQVRKVARSRIRAAKSSRIEVRAWAVQHEPWWRRAYFRATGADPAWVKELYVDNELD